MKKYSGLSTISSKYLELLDRNEEASITNILNTKSSYSSNISRQHPCNETYTISSQNQFNFDCNFPGSNIHFTNCDNNKNDMDEELTEISKPDLTKLSPSPSLKRCAVSSVSFDKVSDSFMWGHRSKRQRNSNQTGDISSLRDSSSLIQKLPEKFAYTDTEALFADNTNLFQTENFTNKISDLKFTLTQQSLMTPLSISEIQFSSCSSMKSRELVCDSKVTSMNTNDISTSTSSEPQKQNKTQREFIINTSYNPSNTIETDAKSLDYNNRGNNDFEWSTVSKQIIEGEKKANDLMEVVLEHVVYNHNHSCIESIVIGDDELHITSNHDCFNCDSISQSIEEIEETFDKHPFICSTPENQTPDISMLNDGFLNVSLENKMETKDDVEMNVNCEKSIHETVENVWSAITHVSSSLPVDSDKDEFDISTIFYITEGEKQTKTMDLNENIPPKDDNNNSVRAKRENLNFLMETLRENSIYPFDLSKSLDSEIVGIVENRKAALMSQIESIMQTMIKSLIEKTPIIYKLHKVKDWKDCTMKNDILSQRETSLMVKSLSFTNKNTERTFTIVTHLLSRIYKMLSEDTSCTKRELYYHDVALLQNQNCVNKAIEEISSMLNVQLWELGILSTSKGLVAGDLQILTDENESINYSVPSNVPQNPSQIKTIQSNAQFILIVEKDTIFTRLIESDVFQKIGSKIILVTGKGYPDINTRVLLKKLEANLKIPIYIVVDADPHGIEIMCTYKYGSLQMVQNSEELAITSIAWIGLHPTDIEKIDITRTNMTENDLKKVDELLKRPYMNDQIENELKHMKIRKLKAEVEAIYHYSLDYFINDYLARQISLLSNPMRKMLDEIRNFSY